MMKKMIFLLAAFCGSALTADSEVTAYNGEKILTSFVSIEPEFFLFTHAYGVKSLDGTDYFVVELEDESRWGIGFENPNYLNILRTWAYGDWITLLPSSFRPGEYLLENKVRSSGQVLTAKNLKLPNVNSPKTNIVQNIVINGNTGSFTVGDNTYDVYDPIHLTVLQGWESQDAVYVNKLLRCNKSNEIISLNEKLIFMNVNKGNSLEALPQ